MVLPHGFFDLACWSTSLLRNQSTWGTYNELHLLGFQAPFDIDLYAEYRGMSAIDLGWHGPQA
jgi:hypothetical protein